MSVRSGGHRGLGVFAVCVAIAATLGGCAGSGAPNYRGDGELTTLPPGARAAWRHELELPPIDLMAPGVREYSLVGLPRENLVAVLTLDQPGEGALRAIEAANTRVRMTVINLGTGDASVKEGRLLGDYGPTPESWAGEPMEFEGIWFRARRHDRFLLRVEVMTDGAGAGQSAPGVLTATPRVRGGTGLGVRGAR